MEEKLNQLQEQAQGVAAQANTLAEQSANLAIQMEQAQGLDPFMVGLMVFVLACFVGYYVVWKVTPALHTPLMAVTNAISGIIILGAIIAAGPVVSDGASTATWLGFFGIILASVNIFGGFVVTQRMLHMFRKKEK